MKMTGLRTFLATALAAFAVQAHALDCLPTTAATPLATGSPRLVVTTPAGEVSAYWCLLPRTADTPLSKVMYAPQLFVVLNKYRSAADFTAAVLRISLAADPYAQTKIEIAAATVVPAPGSQDEYEFKMLRFKGCQALAAKPYLVPIDEMPPDWCGVAPTAPSAPPENWATPPTGTYRLYTTAAGKLATAIAGRIAGPNQTCNCAATKVASGTSTYCPVAAAEQTEVTLCKRVP